MQQAAALEVHVANNPFLQQQHAHLQPYHYVHIDQHRRPQIYELDLEYTSDRDVDIRERTQADVGHVQGSEDVHISVIEVPAEDACSVAQQQRQVGNGNGRFNPTGSGGSMSSTSTKVNDNTV